MILNKIHQIHISFLVPFSRLEDSRNGRVMPYQNHYLSTTVATQLNLEAHFLHFFPPHPSTPRNTTLAWPVASWFDAWYANLTCIRPRTSCPQYCGNWDPLALWVSNKPLSAHLALATVDFPQTSSFQPKNILSLLQ